MAISSTAPPRIEHTHRACTAENNERLLAMLNGRRAAAARYRGLPALLKQLAISLTLITPRVN